MTSSKRQRQKPQPLRRSRRRCTGKRPHPDPRRHGLPDGHCPHLHAAESLEQHAKKRGISIKVETNGSGGAKNILTDAEIAAADGIIVAADKNVAMARFNGKKVVITKVADGINKADELIDRALKGDAPVYHASGSDTEESAADVQGESLGRQIYKHLMNGVSHMLPFVVGGGILIALAFLFDDYSIDPKNFGSNTPLAKFFKDIGGASFGFMLPVLAGFISMSIADRPGLAVGFFGGALAGTTAPASSAPDCRLPRRLHRQLPQEGIEVPAGVPRGHQADAHLPVLRHPDHGLHQPLHHRAAGLRHQRLDGRHAEEHGPVGPHLHGHDRRWHDGRRYGWPDQQGCLRHGTGLLASGEFHVMAAVMAGGMVPPLAIALCTTFFKNRFTESERKAGITNYVMGLSFITEGAIPFAAADPLRVIPACVVGSAVTGA